MKKLKIEETLRTGIIFEGASISDTIQYLEDLQENYKKYTDLKIEADLYGSDGEYVLRGYRLETDSEFNKRISKNKQNKERRDLLKAKQLESEKKQYEKLKKKFENEKE